MGENERTDTQRINLYGRKEEREEKDRSQGLVEQELHTGKKRSEETIQKMKKDKGSKKDYIVG